MNPYLALVLAAAFVFNGFYWHARGVNTENTRWKAKTWEEVARGSQAARDRETTWQGAANAIVKNQDEKLRATQRNLRIALDSLRDRPDRPHENGTEAPGVVRPCATGAELCRPDAEFLIGEAARADECRTGLESSYQFIDQVGK